MPVSLGDQAFLRDFLSVLTSPAASAFATNLSAERPGMILAVDQIIDQAYSHNPINSIASPENIHDRTK